MITLPCMYLHRKYKPHLEGYNTLQYRSTYDGGHLIMEHFPVDQLQHRAIIVNGPHDIQHMYSTVLEVL